jgi:lipopolysaccharide/colanic/teichoic acid biosynthesis glycosyltransferase
MIHEYSSLQAEAPRPWYYAIDPQRRLLRGSSYRAVKRAMDLVMCLAVTPFVLPLMAAITLVIMIDSPGPVLFSQWRAGKGGRRFRMYKFRTMVSNAEMLKSAYAHLNKQTGPDFKIDDDPRVTRVGRFLRRTSLDELPQLFNIIRGDMSLVGPRPTSFSPRTYQLWHTERLDVLPGLTGLWQISGRSNLDFDQRLKLDIAYISRQCIWLDLQILVRTVGQVLAGDGAY